MGNFISLIRFIFNAVLLFLGMVAVVIIAAILNVYSLKQGDSRIIIEPGPLQGRYPTGSEARALRSVLKDRVDELNTSLSNDAGSLEFHIDEGENAASIAARLQALGFIHDAQLFGQLLHYNKIDIQLQAGTYQLRRNMTMRELGAALYRRHSGQSTITVPAGWRLEQLAEHLNVAGVMDGRQFLRRARQGTSVDHYLLADRPPGQSYEGYLFPSAYSLPDNPTPDDLLSQMLNKMASRLPANTFELARQQGLTFYEVLTLASIIEREAVIPTERPVMASVYLNRLSPETSATHLQADPTVQYAMGYQADAGQWWKSPVRLEEYGSVDSPYNTYLYPGLPPGPIASPGLDSIMAVLQPAQTDYLFFVCRRPRCAGGEHVFAKTYAEHLQNVAIYWEQ
jgi:UPF0755 protein